jgi:hypothetical protein
LFVQHISDHAEFMCTFLNGRASVDSMVSFLEAAERPKDLVDACRLDPAVGRTVAIIFETYHTCHLPQCIKAVGEHLQSFCMRVMAAYSVAG